MDGIGDTRAVGDVTILGSGAQEHEETSEGCTVHQRKGLRVQTFKSRTSVTSWTVDTLNRR
jgi:hypothetical protein